MTDKANGKAGKYFGRGFRVQLAFYLGIVCLFLLLRPNVPSINFIFVGYLILFWPLYFLLKYRAQPTDEHRREE